MHVIVIPKNASLRGVIERILSPLKGAEYDDLRKSIEHSVASISEADCAIRLASEMEIVLRDHAQRLKERLLKGDVSEAEQRDLNGQLHHSRSLPKLLTEPALAGHINGHGQRKGGQSFSRGALYRTLQNRIYRGEIVHKGQSHRGEHEAIVDESLWESVQLALQKNRVERPDGAQDDNSLLTGLLYDELGRRMTPSHARKKGRRYRYYVSQRLTTAAKGHALDGWRVPARDLEQLVIDRITRFLLNKAELFSALETSVLDIRERGRLVDGGRALGEEWEKAPPVKGGRVLTDIVDQIKLGPGRVSISIEIGRLRSLISQRLAAPMPESHRGENTGAAEAERVTLNIQTQLKRAGIETRFIVDGEDKSARRTSDASLHRLL
jgi:hypothetical protein